MGDVTPQEFFESKNVSVVAAAGCGKTELICKAVGCGEKLQLVLTHTNAGVQAIKDRFNKLGISSKLYQVETIAGWCLKFTNAYPQICNTTPATSLPDFPLVYDGMVKLLQTHAGHSIIKASYDSAYIDEYQDCTNKQHQVIVLLAVILRIRIVGDPLQSIFDFGNESDPIANWEEEVSKDFPSLGKLTYPWRWVKTAPDLGEWLTNARESLETRKVISLSGLPKSVQWYRWQANVPQKGQRDKQRMSMYKSLQFNGSSIAIHKHPNQVINTCRQMAGRFQPLEEMYSQTMKKFVVSIANSTGKERLKAVRKLLDDCCSKSVIKSEFGTIFTHIIDGSNDFRRAKKNTDLIPLFQKAAVGGVSESIAFVELLLSKFSLNVFRREMLHECIQILKQHDAEPSEPIENLVWNRQYARSLLGRSTRYKQVSRTLIVKGLEFDSGVVLNPRDLSLNDFYVAITRPKSNLIIVHDKNEVIFA